jgi:hypothetical protein
VSVNVNQSIELSTHNVRVVDSERGTLELQGITAESRAMCSAILSSIRCGARLSGFKCIIEFVDAEAVIVESDHPVPIPEWPFWIVP